AADTVPVDDGSGAAAPADASASDAGASGDGGSGDAAAASCSQFASWYDAQTYYEAAGGTDGGSALVNALDPDVDGIACEEMMNS
ncbi:MAG TPA: excalibur calcium-binding domain-containing protein, partial [Thermomicrobiales bacterium]|nr:excalibur calcium-binding domain-containing protein [Thermomicrobiales bacterium]